MVEPTSQPQVIDSNPVIDAVDRVETPTTVQLLRRTVKLAVVSQFVNLFKDHVGLEFTIEVGATFCLTSDELAVDPAKSMAVPDWASTPSLEADLDGTQPLSVIPRLFGKLVNTLTNDHTTNSASNWQQGLKKAYSSRAAADVNPFVNNGSEVEWLDLAVQDKASSHAQFIEVLYNVCQWHMRDPERFRKNLKEGADVSWRLEPVGLDSRSNKYYVLRDNRVWIHRNPPVPSVAPSSANEQAAAQIASSATTEAPTDADAVVGQKRPRTEDDIAGEDAKRARADRGVADAEFEQVPQEVLAQWQGPSSTAVSQQAAEIRLDEDGLVQWERNLVAERQRIEALSHFVEWEAIAVTKRDWQTLVKKFESSANSDEAALSAKLLQLLPSVSGSLDAQEKEFATLHRKKSDRIAEQAAPKSAETATPVAQVQGPAGPASEAPAASEPTQVVTAPAAEDPAPVASVGAPSAPAAAADNQQVTATVPGAEPLSELAPIEQKVPQAPTPAAEAASAPVQPEVSNAPVIATAAAAPPPPPASAPAPAPAPAPTSVAASAPAPAQAPTPASATVEAESNDRGSRASRHKLHESLDEAALLDPTRNLPPAATVDANAEDPWYFDCEICGMAGWNLDDGTETMCCDKCEEWQHIDCHRQNDAARGRPPVDYTSEAFEFVCLRCQMNPKRKKRQVPAILPPPKPPKYGQGAAALAAALPPKKPRPPPKSRAGSTGSSSRPAKPTPPPKAGKGRQGSTSAGSGQARNGAQAGAAAGGATPQMSYEELKALIESNPALIAQLPANYQQHFSQLLGINLADYV
ncbi:hypothetical protein OIO90_000883 [Microbotryomycetes sp. JL221]|nr:hypothetical protein OIO90_000883 [Microbotryomycetes sp. JL221]